MDEKTILNKSFIKTKAFQKKVNEILTSPLIGEKVRVSCSNEKFISGIIVSETQNSFLISKEYNSKDLKKVIKFGKQVILIRGLKLPVKIFNGTLRDRISKSYYVHK